jgi:hypothetical protein
MENNWSHPSCWKKVEELIKLYGKKSPEDVMSSNVPNMEKCISEDQSEMLGFKTNETNEILEKFPNMPFELKCLYKVIGNPSIEYYFNNWTLISLNQLEMCFNNMKKANNTRIVDFGLKYSGMGHCVVCAYDTLDSKIFYRRDGGSNGWDRENNWNFISKYIPEEDKKHNFMQWIYDVKNPKDFISQPWKHLEDPKIVNP